MLHDMFAVSGMDTQRGTRAQTKQKQKKPTFNQAEKGQLLTGPRLIRTQFQNFFFFLGAKGKEQNQEWGLQKKTSVINDTAEQKRGMRERMITRAMQYWEPFCPNRSLYFIMFHLNTNHNSKKGQKKKKSIWWMFYRDLHEAKKIKIILKDLYNFSLNKSSTQKNPKNSKGSTIYIWKTYCCCENHF